MMNLLVTNWPGKQRDYDGYNTHLCQLNSTRCEAIRKQEENSLCVINYILLCGNISFTFCCCYSEKVFVFIWPNQLVRPCCCGRGVGGWVVKAMREFEAKKESLWSSLETFQILTGWIRLCLCCVAMFVQRRDTVSPLSYPSPAIASTLPFTKNQCLNVHLIKWIMIIIICHFNDFQIWCWLWFSSA